MASAIALFLASTTWTMSVAHSPPAPRQRRLGVAPTQNIRWLACSVHFSSVGSSTTGTV